MSDADIKGLVERLRELVKWYGSPQRTNLSMHDLNVVEPILCEAADALERLARPTESAPDFKASHNLGERDPSVMLGWAGADTVTHTPPAVAPADNNAERLLPCPHCEGEATFCDFEGWWQIKCQRCGARSNEFPGVDNREKTIKNWNTRTPPAVPATPVAWRWTYRSSPRIWNFVEVDPTSSIMCAPEFIVEPLYAAPVPAHSDVRSATIEECAKVCDQFGEENETRITDDPASHIFATISNTANDCAEMIRDLSTTAHSLKETRP